MDKKDRYYLALKENNGRLNEIHLGEILGFEDDFTRRIIAQLMSEHKIEFYENGSCNYRIMAGFRGKNRKINLR